MSSAAIPTALGKYEIRGMLGRGAMGVVYDGWDPAIDRRIAIKTVSRLPSDDEAHTEALARFRREAQAAGRLHHPNIVSVFDYGETEDLAYIVMEFVEGRTLKDMATERMAAGDAIRIMSDVLAGLDYSHERGVVHRDLKPANIILTASGQAKIADFGIARIESSSMTQVGTVMGTPAYMSPEQFMGHVVDRRTDIYSCGVILYQLLAGERPFEGSLSSIMHKVMTTKPLPPSALTVTAPRALDAVVAKAMAVRPEDRYATAPAFAEALRAPPPAADGDDATIVRPNTVAVPPLPARASSSSRAGVIVGAVLVLAIGGGAAWMLLGRRPETPPLPAQAVVTPPAPQRATPPEPPRSALASIPSTPADVPPPLPVPAAPVEAAGPPATSAPPSSPSNPVEAMNAPPALVAPPVTPAPVVPPQPPPPPLAPPTRSATEAAALVAASLPAIGCSLSHASAGPGGVIITGLAGSGDPAAALRRAAAAADPAGVDWQVRSVADTYCSTLDLLRSVPEPASGPISLEQDGGPLPLADDQVIGLRVTMPGFAGFLSMAYVQSNATVSPLVPSADYPSQTYPARGSIVLGTPHGRFAGWHAGPPFGTDMVVAVVSTAPLFAHPPDGDMPLQAYLANLGNAIQGLRRKGGSVAATATMIETRPGPATPAVVPASR